MWGAEAWPRGSLAEWGALPGLRAQGPPPRSQRDTEEAPAATGAVAVLSPPLAGTAEREGQGLPRKVHRRVPTDARHPRCPPPAWPASRVEEEKVPVLMGAGKSLEEP